MLLMLFQVSAASNSSVNAAGRNAVVTSLLICCGFVVCWTPTVIYCVMMIFGYITEASGPWYEFVQMMAIVNSCINPLIYAAKYHEFQTGVRCLLRKRQVQPAVQRVVMQVRDVAGLQS